MFGFFKSLFGKKQMSVYDEIGGAAAVDAAVDIFYRKVLSDDRISEFFDTVDMDAQIVKQKAFLTMAFGGPNEYTGLDMREGHKHMNLTEEHFNAVAENLIATLEELNVPQDKIDAIVAIALSVKDDVLNR
jgi:hemoglobin